MRSPDAVAIASLMVVFALAGCMRTSVAPSPAAVEPPAVGVAPPVAAARPPAAAPPPLRPPAPAPVPSPEPKTLAQAPALPAAVAAPPAKPVATPTLDLASLETRLRASGAIGVFTKRPALAALRRQDDLPLLKVLSLRSPPSRCSWAASVS